MKKQRLQPTPKPKSPPQPVVGADGEILESVPVEAMLAEAIVAEEMKRQPTHLVLRLTEWIGIAAGLVLALTAIIGLILLLTAAPSQRSLIEDWVTVIMFGSLLIGVICIITWEVTNRLLERRTNRQKRKQRKPGFEA